MTISQVAIAKAQTNIAAQQAALDLAKAEMATAQWRLERTEVRALADGTINNLTVRVGDTARAEVPLIGVVDAAAWRIVANYKQDYLRYFRVGGTAWVWLDSHPWHLHRARITGIARAINESTEDNPLYFVIAGPMEVPFRGIERSEPARRRFVYCISHSRWNDGFASRYTFVIDKEGVVRQVYTQVNTGKHPDEVLDYVKANLK